MHVLAQNGKGAKTSQISVYGS